MTNTQQQAVKTLSRAFNYLMASKSENTIAFWMAVDAIAQARRDVWQEVFETEGRMIIAFREMEGLD